MPQNTLYGLPMIEIDLEQSLNTSKIAELEKRIDDFTRYQRWVNFGFSIILTVVTIILGVIL